MARLFKKRGRVQREVDVLDWQLIARLDELFQKYGEVAFEARDSRGVLREDGLDSFRSAIESHDEHVEEVTISLMKFEGRAMVWWESGKSGSYVAEAEDEGFVTHIATRAPELLEAAADRLDAKRQLEASAQTQEAAPSRFRRFLYDPWTIRVGGGLTVAAILALIVWASR